MTWPGEEQAWEELSKLNPSSVALTAIVRYDFDSSSYIIPCFGQDINVLVKTHEFRAETPAGHYLINELGSFSRLSILKYLSKAKDLPLSGDFIKPSDLKGGDIFRKGTHVIPTDDLSTFFGERLDSLFKAAELLDGSRLAYGDAAVRLFPLPRIPVVIIIWSGSEEFHGKASFLFDSTCIEHLPSDILWATAMTTVKILLKI